VLTLALLSPVAVLGLLLAMAAVERRLLGSEPRRTSPPVADRQRTGPGRAGTRREP
jgi:hypothetical protein